MTVTYAAVEESRIRNFAESAAIVTQLCRGDMTLHDWHKPGALVRCKQFIFISRFVSHAH